MLLSRSLRCRWTGRVPTGARFIMVGWHYAIAQAERPKRSVRALLRCSIVHYCGVPNIERWDRSDGSDESIGEIEARPLSLLAVGWKRPTISVVGDTLPLSHGDAPVPVCKMAARQADCRYGSRDVVVARSVGQSMQRLREKRSPLRGIFAYPLKPRRAIGRMARPSHRPVYYRTSLSGTQNTLSSTRTRARGYGVVGRYRVPTRSPATVRAGLNGCGMTTDWALIGALESPAPARSAVSPDRGLVSPAGIWLVSRMKTGRRCRIRYHALAPRRAHRAYQ